MNSTVLSTNTYADIKPNQYTYPPNHMKNLINKKPQN
jgi:hypothetical protein